MALFVTPALGQETKVCKFPSIRPSVHINEYLGGYIWWTVSVYLNGIYSRDT